MECDSRRVGGGCKCVAFCRGGTREVFVLVASTELLSISTLQNLRKGANVISTGLVECCHPMATTQRSFIRTRRASHTDFHFTGGGTRIPNTPSSPPPRHPRCLSRATRTTATIGGRTPACGLLPRSGASGRGASGSETQIVECQVGEAIQVKCAFPTNTHEGHGRGIPGEFRGGPRWSSQGRIRSCRTRPASAPARSISKGNR